MPLPIDEIIKRRVVQQWLSGESRDKIAADNNISSGTVTSIVDNYKIRLDNLDFGSFRELMAEAKKQGLTPSELASHTRLYNYFRSSGANEEKIESFITRVSTADISPENIFHVLINYTRSQQENQFQFTNYQVISRKNYKRSKR
jgi:cell division GTPase FtsZ